MAKTLVVSSSILTPGEGYDEPKAFFIDVDPRDSWETLVDVIKRMLVIQYPRLDVYCSMRSKFECFHVSIIHNFDSSDTRPKFIKSQLAYQLRQSRVWLDENRVRMNRQ